MKGNASAPPDYGFLSALDAPMTRPRAAFGYQCSLVLVAVTMILLPIIYCALVGTVAYGVYYHATHNWSAIMDWGSYRGGRVFIFKFLIYLVPLLAGVVVVLFMIKPMLAGRPKRAQPLALNPADHPLLFAFIEKICRHVGAPSPRRIDLDCQLNASAGFRRGFFSMAGNDLVLTLGLPLVANCTAAELAGVVAHEFGHFNQPVGMRLTYLIRSISFWFVRVAYERDAWDEALEDWGREVEDGRIGMVVWSCQFAVWFSRLVLKGLMFVGMLVGGVMLRQMEYDADASHIRLTGTDIFERTHRKLATLGVATGVMHRQIASLWKKEKKLPDNLSELLRQAHRSLPPDVIAKIENSFGLEKTGLFDSHPSPAARIAAARRMNQAGIFHDDRPASSLFSNFDYPSRFVTFLHYTDDLGIPIEEKMLAHVVTEKEAAGPARKLAFSGNEACDDYFCGLAPLFAPLPLPVIAAPSNLDAAATELNQLAAGLHQVEEQLFVISEEYAATTVRLAALRTARCLLGQKALFKPEHLGLTETGLTLAQAEALENETQATRDQLRHSAREAISAFLRRLELGLAIATAGTEGAEALVRAQATRTHLEQAAGKYAAWRELALELTVLGKLYALRDIQSETPGLSRAFAAQQTLVRNQHDALRPPVAATTTPAPAGRLQISRSAPSAAPQDEFGGIAQEIRAWQEAYYGGLAELVELARAVENPPAPAGE